MIKESAISLKVVARTWKLRLLKKLKIDSRDSRESKDASAG